TLQQRTDRCEAYQQRPHEPAYFINQQRRQTKSLQRRQHDEMQHPYAADPQRLGQLPGYPAATHGRQSSTRSHRCCTSTISYSTTPPGVFTATMSPSSLAIKARAMGEVT